MIRRHLISFYLGLALPALATADPKPLPENPTLTFYVAGVECPACVFVVNDAVRRLDGVDEVSDGQNDANFINVTFDPAIVSAHQIAQAVTGTFPLHGAPYVATLKLVVPDYREGENAAKVAAVFAKWKEWVEVEAVKPVKGELVVKFHALPGEPGKTKRDGWNHENLSTELIKVLPAGTTVELMKEK